MDIDTDALAADLARTLRGVAVDALPEAIERRLTGVPLNLLQVEMVKGQVHDDLFAFGPFTPVLADPMCTRIQVRGLHIHVERRGRWSETNLRFWTDAHRTEHLGRLRVEGHTVVEVDGVIEVSRASEL
ncbi:MAG: hypothetical protein KC656_35670 [Myxococcales bacterium]|nr:hypothetical protein [Myxococcales bacterium]